MTDVLRLAMRATPRGVMRPIAEFPAERAAEAAHHAEAIAALSGAQWEIQTTMGRVVKVLDAPVPVPPLPAEPAPPPEPPKVSAIAGLWALIRGR